jgi:regulator of sirC expression with transglutaminase-like and TPR domain
MTCMLQHLPEKSKHQVRDELQKLVNEWPLEVAERKNKEERKVILKGISICQKKYHNCRNKYFLSIILYLKWYLLRPKSCYTGKVIMANL